MAAVLGIDAAWTAHNPSGVAVAVERDGRWCLAALASSYREFLSSADSTCSVDPGAGEHMSYAPLLLQAGERRAGQAIDLVAIDMPLARTPIRGRREADNAVSRLYARRKCATHSPTAARPGKISDDLHAGFEAAGYRLCTDAIVTPGLIEVYPHPALIELAGAAERLPYKAGKTLTYWRYASVAERRARLLEQWAAIVALLDREIAGVSAALPPPTATASGIALKAYEDRIDAVVCAWVAIVALAGGAHSVGDADAAIWIPRTRVSTGEA